MENNENMTTPEQVVGGNMTFFEIFIAFWSEIFGFFKYIFNDVWLGLDP